MTAHEAEFAALTALTIELEMDVRTLEYLIGDVMAEDRAARIDRIVREFPAKRDRHTDMCAVLRIAIESDVRA